MDVPAAIRSIVETSWGLEGWEDSDAAPKKYSEVIMRLPAMLGGMNKRGLFRGTVNIAKEANANAEYEASMAEAYRRKQEQEAAFERNKAEYAAKSKGLQPT